MEQRNYDLLKVDEIHMLLDIIIEKMALREELLAESDKYYLFFLDYQIPRGDRSRVYSLKRVLWCVFLSFFKEKTQASDLRLVFPLDIDPEKHIEIMYELTQGRTLKYRELYKFLVEKMKNETRIESFLGPKEIPKEGSAVIVRSKGRDVSLFFSQEQADFRERILTILEEETGLLRSLIIGSGRAGDYPMVRYVALLIFFKRYNNASTLILGHVIGRSREGTESILKKISDYYSEKRFKEFPDVIAFWELIEKVTSRLNTL